MLVFVLVAVEAVLVRPVITVLGPEDQSLGYPNFRGKGDFLKHLGRFGPGPAPVVNLFIS